MTTPEQIETFQERVAPWMDQCFGPEISGDREERNHRFLEEALELVQSAGCTRAEAHSLVDYVYGRPVGDLEQEVGGVMVTLAALCLAHKVDMHAAGETELARVWTKIEKIRAKQAAKPKHSPLPEVPAGAVYEALHEQEREAMRNAKAKLRIAFRKALSDLPEIAPPEIASVLSSVYMKDIFQNEGKRLQREHGTDAVAPRLEQECGAGAWSFMRQGVLAALAPDPVERMCIGCANGTDLPDGQECQVCGRLGLPTNADRAGETRGPYEALFLKGMPVDCCDFGVVSLSEGREVCRVWREQDARAISRALASLETAPAAARLAEALNTAIYRFCVLEDLPSLNSGTKALVQKWIGEARVALDETTPDASNAMWASRLEALELERDEALAAPEMWCQSCGTVTRTGRCDCTEYGDPSKQQLEPHAAALAKQANDFRARVEAAEEEIGALKHDHERSMRSHAAAEQERDTLAGALSEQVEACEDPGCEMCKRHRDLLVNVRQAAELTATRLFRIGDRVTKRKGASWTGRVVGLYSTSLTPCGYDVESENEPGSVQLYPEIALTAAPRREDDAHE